MLFLIRILKKKDESLPARVITTNDKINNMSPENPYNVDEKPLQHCLYCSVHFCNPKAYPGVGLGCLTTLSTIFQLYRGSQVY